MHLHKSYIFVLFDLLLEITHKYILIEKFISESLYINNHKKTGFRHGYVIGRLTGHIGLYQTKVPKII